MTGNIVLDVISSVFFLLGASLCLAAALALLRLPDLLSRVHAISKPQVLGLLLVLVGCAFQIHSVTGVTMLFLTGLFQLTTAPVAAHMSSQAIYRTGQVRADTLVLDELSPELDRSAARFAQGIAPPPIAEDGSP